MSPTHNGDSLQYTQFLKRNISTPVTPSQYTQSQAQTKQSPSLPPAPGTSQVLPFVQNDDWSTAHIGETNTIENKDTLYLKLYLQYPAPVETFH